MGTEWTYSWTLRWRKTSCKTYANPNSIPSGSVRSRASHRFANRISDIMYEKSDMTTNCFPRVYNISCVLGFITNITRYHYPQRVTCPFGIKHLKILRSHMEGGIELKLTAFITMKQFLGRLIYSFIRIATASTPGPPCTPNTGPNLAILTCSGESMEPMRSARDLASSGVVLWTTTNPSIWSVAFA